MAILEENLLEIKKPDTGQGWTTYQLENYNFHFWLNKTIKKNWKKVLEILNKYLLSFQYYKATDVSLNNTTTYISKLIIDDDVIDKINKETPRSLFTKGIFEYSGFTSNLIKKSEFNNELQKIQDNSLKQDEQQKTILKLKNNSDMSILSNLQGGIYGIYSISDIGVKQLLYVGLTHKTFNTRWQQHLEIIRNPIQIPKGMEKLYFLLIEKAKNYTLVMEPIIDFDKNISNRPLTRNEHEAMECALITALQPPGNTAGVDVLYKFSE